MWKIYDKIEPYLFVLFVFLSAAISFVKEFLVKWSGFITIPFALLLVFLAEKIVTCFYPNSTRYDVGFHYDVIYSVAAWLILHEVSYFILKINWSKLERYVDIDLDKIWNDLTPYQQTKISIGLFFAYLFSAILTFLAVSLS